MQKEESIAKACIRKYPEQIIIVTAKHNDRENAMVAGWCAFASENPVMFMIGISENSFTYELLKKSGEFVVSFPSDKMAKEVIFLGENHGHNFDKLKKSGVKTERGHTVSAPILTDSVANFECKLKAEYKPGSSMIIIGEVLKAFVNTNESLKRIYTIGKKHKLGSIETTMLDVKNISPE